MAAKGSTTRKKKSTAQTSVKKSAARTKASSGSSRKSSGKKEYGVFREAAVLLILAMSIVFFIANFGVGGVVGAAISSFFFGLFGVVAYVFPILLFVGTVFGIANKNNSLARIKLIAGFLVLVLLCTFIQLVYDSNTDAWKYSDYYVICSGKKCGGGFFGGSICKLFVTWFGKVGAFIIDIVLIIIGVVVITERSFISGLKKGSRKVYDTAVNDAKQYREDVEIKRQNREAVRLKRAEKKREGVTFDTEIVESEAPSYVYTEVDDAGDEVATENNREPVEDEIVPKRRKRAQDTAEQDKKTFDETVLPFDAKRYGNVEDVTDYVVKHYEEEQCDVMTPGYSEEVVDTDSHAADSDIGLDMELVRAEYEKEEAVRASQNSAVSKESEAEEYVEVPKAVVKQKPKRYIFPQLSLLKKGQTKGNTNNQDELRTTARKLQDTLANFGVKVTVTDVSCGPAVTRYELQPEQGVKVSKIVSLADDIKLNLAASDIRIEAPIPGKAAVGIEVPNKVNSAVMLGDLIGSREFREQKSLISFAAGKDIGGQIVMADIAKMPHLLIAGATGSGKSVCINTIIMSILYKASPDDVKLIMIDPKVVELSVYNGIPHLLIPVVTDPKKAAGALNWAVAEMTDRYNKFAQHAVRDLKSYNEKIMQLEDSEDAKAPAKLPQIVVIVDELADLMMVSSNEVEDAIVRLSQLARAAGIHLIIATQRPSVNVITGLIKANVPSRIAFSVSSGVDSRTIIDMNGAEKLLGKGDMLFYPQGYQKPARVQGAFVSDEEVTAVVEFIKEKNGTGEYSEEIQKSVASGSQASGGIGSGSAQNTDDDNHDSFFADSGRLVIEKERASIGLLQRAFKIGFNRAARIMDQLCEAGVVGPEEGTKPRKILMTTEEFEEYLNSNR